MIMNILEEVINRIKLSCVFIKLTFFRSEVDFFGKKNEEVLNLQMKLKHLCHIYKMWHTCIF